MTTVLESVKSVPIEMNDDDDVLKTKIFQIE